MISQISFTLLLAAANLTALLGQEPTAATLSTDSLISEAGPTFRLADSELPDPLTLIAYGDQRFTNPANTRQTNPRLRQWLVNQIAKEHPAAVIMNGDVPLAGGVADDYAVFETPRRKPGATCTCTFSRHLAIMSFTATPQPDLENWWNAFPPMRNRRWYSAQLGSRVYLIALDSDTSLLPGSNQARWIEKQIQVFRPPSIS